MAIDETERTEMVQKLIDTLGGKPAATLMKCVYPDGVDVFAAKDDLTALEVELFSARRNAAAGRGSKRPYHRRLTRRAAARLSCAKIHGNGRDSASRVRRSGRTHEEHAKSEQQRTRLYAWLREQTDEPLAEYLMACLAPAPLSDLVTKDHLSAVLSAELSRLATKEEMNAGFAALRNEFATQRAEDRAEMAAQRAEDQRTAQHRHYWLTGTVVSAGLSLGVPIWLSTLGIIG